MAQVLRLLIRELNTELATFHPRGTKHREHGSKWGSPWTGRNTETKEMKWEDSPKDNRFLCQHQVRWKEKLVQRCELVDSQFRCQSPVQELLSYLFGQDAC